MKIIFKLSLIVILLFAATSCIEVETRVKVNKDGSGTVEERAVASPAMVAMINSFASMGDSSDTEEFSLIDEDELKANAEEMGAGVRFIKVESLDESNNSYVAYYEFDDVRNLKITSDPGNKVPSDVMNEDEEQTDPEKDEFISFDFISGDSPTLIIQMPPKDEEDLEMEFGDSEMETDSLADDMWAEQFKMMLKDMRFVVTVEVAGDIDETNASYVDGSRVTIFEMDLGQIIDNPKKFNELKKNKPATFDELAMQIKDLPGIKIELRDKVKIKFD